MMTRDQAEATIRRWHATLDDRWQQAQATGLPRDYNRRIHPSWHEAPDYWRAMLACGRIEQEDYDEMVREDCAYQPQPH
jgi:hypothetical protein